MYRRAGKLCRCVQEAGARTVSVAMGIGGKRAYKCENIYAGTGWSSNVSGYDGSKKTNLRTYHVESVER